MNKRSRLAFICTVAAVCTLLTTSAWAAAAKDKKTVSRQPVKTVQTKSVRSSKTTVSQPVEESTDTVRIGIREGQGRVSLTSPQGLGIYRGNSLWKKSAANVPVTVTLSGTDLALNGTAGKGNLRVRSLGKDGVIKITDGYTYRGDLELMKSPGRWGITVVNVLPVEQYLYGVVGKEMSPSWSEEALKAQAVAARTYAIAHKKRFSQRGFDLTDDTSSQVYAGVGGESPAVIKAVNATKGEILTYQGKPIDAFFFSTAGGWTENSENVWGTYIPYLRGVSDTSNKMPGYRWSVTTTPEKMETKLAAAGKGVGKIKSITLSPLAKRPMTESDRGVSGRVQSLIIHGTKGNVTVKGLAFQSIFGLRSTLFDFTAARGRHRIPTRGRSPASATLRSKRDSP